LAYPEAPTPFVGELKIDAEFKKAYPKPRRLDVAGSIPVARSKTSKLRKHRYQNSVALLAAMGWLFSSLFIHGK
jgi:hypothetical protein